MGFINRVYWESVLSQSPGSETTHQLPVPQSSYVALVAVAAVVVGIAVPHNLLLLDG